MNKEILIDNIISKYLEDLIISDMHGSITIKLDKSEIEKYCSWANDYRQQLEEYLPEHV